MNDLLPAGDLLVASDQRHLIHPLHHAKDHANPKVFVSGEGAMLRTADGREYIDGLSADGASGLCFRLCRVHQ